MSRSKKWWRATAENAVQEYPALKDRLQALQSQSLTAAYGERIGSSGPTRTTENVATKELPWLRQRQYEAVTKAIEATSYLPEGSRRLRLIELIYWKKSHNMEGAALVVNISVAKAWRWQREFLYMVGGYIGVED